MDTVRLERLPRTNSTVDRETRVRVTRIVDLPTLRALRDFRAGEGPETAELVRS